MRAIEASTLHHLFTCAAEGRDVALAYGYARAALEAYGPRHPRIPQLAGDLARFWMYLGQHARALPVFEAVEPLLPDLSERMITAANAARAAARAGYRSRYAAARARVTAMVAENVAGTRVADAWLIVAWADADAGQWVTATDAASRAVQLAQTRDESEILVQAEAQLQALLARRVPTEGPLVPESPAIERDGAVLADELLVRIGELQPA
jgi:hypothetical protein